MYRWTTLNEKGKAARLRTVKKEATKAAKELFYPKDVLKKIENAKTPRDVNNIMIDARKYL